MIPVGKNGKATDVRIAQLRKSYGSIVAVDVPELVIPSGQSFGLVGNNGAGKTTLFRMILDLVGADEGEVHLGGEPVSKSTAWKHNTGAYLDEGFLIDFLTPEEYFGFVGRLHGLSTADTAPALERLSDLFTEVVLGEGRYIRTLSMGNRKKVGLVAALMTAPGLVVLDEPFAGLDPTSQIKLGEVLKEAHAAGATLLISSHDLTHVTDLCERITLLEGGKVVSDTVTTDETLRDLRHYFSNTEAAARGYGRTRPRP